MHYEAAVLRIERDGQMWIVMKDEREMLVSLDVEADALKFVELVRQRNLQCYVGRGNRRDDRRSYIVEYWEQSPAPKDMPEITLANEDCVTYDPTTIRMNRGPHHDWVIADKRGSLSLLADTESDAGAIVAVAKSHHALCFVGRRTASSPWNVVQYWK